MRNNQTEYLLSVGPLVKYALSKFQSGPARPVLRGIAELGAAFGADVRQYAAHPPKPAESIVQIPSRRQFTDFPRYFGTIHLHSL